MFDILLTQTFKNLQIQLDKRYSIKIVHKTFLFIILFKNYLYLLSLFLSKILILK